MVYGFNILVELIKNSDEFVGGKLKKLVETLPIGIKKAIKAEKPDCSVAINGKNWIYIRSYDGIMIGNGHQGGKPGDVELELYYDDQDMFEIEPGYKTVMAHLTEVVLATGEGDDRELDYDDYDFEITKISDNTFECSVFWSTDQFEFRHIGTKEITLNFGEASIEDQDSESTNLPEANPQEKKSTNTKEDSSQKNNLEAKQDEGSSK